jgi:hypothetical protein
MECNPQVIIVDQQVLGGDQKMDFGQAEESYQELQRQLEAGEISEEAYRERLNALRVMDTEGRTWMLQERTGAWFVWNQGVWEPGDPPRAVTEPPPPPVTPLPVDPGALKGAVTEPSPATPVRPAPEAELEPETPDRGKNIFGLVWRLLLWAGIVGVLLYAAVQSDVELAGYGVIALAAAVGLLVLLIQLLRTYEGTIERVRIEEETDTDEDGSTTTRKVTYAYVRTPENKVRKVKAKKGFERGDLVYKRVGDWGPRKAKE